MPQQVHGHEVMQMMLSGDASYTKASLCAAIIKQFGADTRFFTCRDQDMTAEELVEFLQSRGKFVEMGDGFNTRPDKICNH